MRRQMIAGNWKMNFGLVEARALVAGLRSGLEAEFGEAGACESQPEVLICPPVHLLFPMAKAVAGTAIGMGAQNVHDADKGAYTGEVSVSMVAETGATHVIIGHSERRHVFGEDPAWLARKLRAVVGAGLTCVYCVGETLAEREAGQTSEVVLRQVQDAIDGSIPSERLVVAYEPVWAIGTGRTASPEQAQEVHGSIRAELGAILGDSGSGVRILYGGSVKPSNAGDLLAQSDIDGALVGGASLVSEDFLAIIHASTVVAR